MNKIASGYTMFNNTSKLQKAVEHPKLVKEKIKRDTVGKIAKSYYQNSLSSRSIWESDWDVAIILDACRPDVIEQFAGDFNFIPNNVPVHTSNATSSEQWMKRNFKSEYTNFLQNTTYITGNPFSDSIDTSAFESIDEVWKYGWSEELGTQPPKPITDRAVKIGREHRPDRLLIHYMQPHFPSIPDQIGTQIDIEEWGNDGSGPDAFQKLKRGTISYDDIWTSYEKNCEHVLESVNVLLKNYDADSVVITADHANAFGEFGFYGHPVGCNIPAVTNVPFIKTRASDTHGYMPDTHPKNNLKSDRQSQLKSLGYL